MPPTPPLYARADALQSSSCTGSLNSPNFCDNFIKKLVLEIINFVSFRRTSPSFSLTRASLCAPVGAPPPNHHHMRPLAEGLDPPLCINKCKYALCIALYQTILQEEEKEQSLKKYSPEAAMGMGSQPKSLVWPPSMLTSKLFTVVNIVKKISSDF